MSEKCWYRDHAEKGCKVTKRPGCENEYYYCSKDAENYHKLCDRVWNITDKELSEMSVRELEKLEEDATVCVYMRQRSQALCIHPKCRDQGHAGAIKKVQNKIRKIKHAAYKRDVEELYQKWLANPEDESIYDAHLKRKPSTLKFPPIKNQSWEEYLKAIAINNELKYVVNRWKESDPVFPNQWGVVIFLENGEEYVSFNEDKELAFQELSSDLVNVFCADPGYRKAFWKKFKPEGWYDYKTNTRVEGVKPSKMTASAKPFVPGKPLWIKK